MEAQSERLAVVERVAADLEAQALEPVLVGGMALVVLGSRRITQDFDFLIATPPTTEALMPIMYSSGLELVTKLTPEGNIRRTVDRERIASLKVAGTRPESLFFFRSGRELRVDLLIDFPVPAHGVAARATRVRLQNRKVRVAHPQDLLRMKELARSNREHPGDVQDIDFLKQLLSRT